MLIDNSITSLVKDEKGNIWVGTEEGISKWIRNHNTYQQIKFNQAGAIPHTHISSLFKDNKSNIWVGSKEGLSLYQENKNEWVHFAADNQKLAILKDLPVSAIVQDAKGNIWIGSDSLELYRITLAQANEQVKHFNIKSGLLDIHTTALASDEMAEVIWIGTRRGLQALHLDQLKNKQSEETSESKNQNKNQNQDNNRNTDKLFTSFLHKANDQNSISSNHITGLLLNRSGDLWIETVSQGLDKYLNSKVGFLHC